MGNVCAKSESDRYMDSDSSSNSSSSGSSSSSVSSSSSAGAKESPIGISDLERQRLVEEFCMNEILTKTIWLGNQYAAGFTEPMTGVNPIDRFHILRYRYGITHIVCCIDRPKIFEKAPLSSRKDPESISSKDALSSYPPEEACNGKDALSSYPPEEACNGMKYLVIPMSDTKSFDILPCIERTNRFIHEAVQEENGRVLVHCFLGQSRSAAIVIAYIMWARGMDYENTYGFVKGKRKYITADRFQVQLREYERRLRMSPAQGGKR